MVLKMDDNSNTMNTPAQTPDENKEARENLKAVLEVGIAVQTIGVTITYAMKKGKEDFLKKLNDLLVEFQNGLSEDEKKELGEDVNTMIDQKADELIKSLGEELTEEELEAAITEIKEATKEQAS